MPKLLDIARRIPRGRAGSRRALIKSSMSPRRRSARACSFGLLPARRVPRPGGLYGRRCARSARQPDRAAAHCRCEPLCVGRRRERRWRERLRGRHLRCMGLLARWPERRTRLHRHRVGAECGDCPEPRRRAPLRCSVRPPDAARRSARDLGARRRERAARARGYADAGDGWNGSTRRHRLAAREPRRGLPLRHHDELARHPGVRARRADGRAHYAAARDRHDRHAHEARDLAGRCLRVRVEQLRGGAAHLRAQQRDGRSHLARHAEPARVHSR